MDRGGRADEISLLVEPCHNSPYIGTAHRRKPHSSRRPSTHVLFQLLRKDPLSLSSSKGYDHVKLLCHNSDYYVSGDHIADIHFHIYQFLLSLNIIILDAITKYIWNIYD